MMTRKMLWYACLGLLCCGALAFVVNAAAIYSDDLSLEKARRHAEAGPTNTVPPELQKPEPQASETISPAESTQMELEYLGSPSNIDLAIPEAYRRWLETGTATPAEKAIIEQFLNPDGESRGGNPLDTTGSDCNSYRFVDNTDGDTATFAWIELDADPLATSLVYTSRDDGVSPLTPLGFDFPFYGVNQDSFRASTNGNIQFTTAVTSFSNACLPSTVIAGPAIAVMWDDLHLTRGGDGVSTDSSDVVRYRYFAAEGYTVIEWDSVGLFSTACTAELLRFEVILYTDGRIKVQYHTYVIPATCTDSSQTIGIQSNGAAGSAAANYLCNPTVNGNQPASGRAVWFYPDAGPFSGRCCYGNPFSPTCVVNTAAECAALCGTFSCTITCDTPCPPACANLTCPAGSLDEDELWACGVAPTPDTDNGGCNSTPPVFDTLSCGQTVCGTTLALGGTRDTDWYEITVASPQIVSWTARGPFAILIGTLNSPCPQTLFRRSTTGASCVQTTVTDTFQTAGTYYLFVAKSNFTDLALSPYVATVTCTPFVPPIARCCYGDPTAPQCTDTTQARCTQLGGTWTIGLNCTNNPCPVCVVNYVVNAPGSLGPISTCGMGDDCVAPNGRAGQDIMIQLNIPSTGLWNIAFCMPDNLAWDSFAYLRSLCCGGTLIASNDDGCADNSDGFDDPLFSCIQLNAGTYYLDFEPFSSTVCSLMTLNVTSAAPCVVTCQGGDVLETTEACDSTNAVSDPNGGCNNDDNGGINTWGAIDCGQTVCGSVFTYVGPGGGSFRDTDWYRVTVADSESLSVRVITEGIVLFGVINENGCTGPAFISSAITACGTCTSYVNTPCIGPGTYSVFVAPSVFTGIPCPGNDYRLTLTCTPCGINCEDPDSLTVYRRPALADTVELRWVASQNIGFYTVYGTAVKNNDGDPDHGADPNWTLLALLPAPGTPGTMTYLHSPLVSYMNYVVEHDCSPRGRCCYGDPGNPSCLSPATQAECDALTGGWTAGLNCTDNPCPIPPANDLCGDAITVTAGVEVAGTNVLATGTDISVCAFNDLYDVWYVYTPAATGTATFSLCNAAGSTLSDPTLSLFDECGGAQLACDDDGCPADLRSTFTFGVTLGEDYFIRVAGYSATTGTFNLLVTQ